MNAALACELVGTGRDMKGESGKAFRACFVKT